MTLRDKKDPEIEAIQFSSSKELDAEFAGMLAVYRDRETEQNWEARDKSVTRLRGILRGDANEKYHDSLILGVRQMVDGINKAVESLRTSLALNALTLVAEIGYYLGRSIDTYIYDRLVDCLIKLATTTKKVIASALQKTTTTFLRHATYHHKVMNMLWIAMNEKNNQSRQLTVLYIKTILQAHTHREHTRTMMDRTGGTDLLVKILSRGLDDPTPTVREVCREAFWIFWEHWKDRGETLLKSLPPQIRKPLEKSKNAALAKTRTIHSPTNSTSSLRTSSSMGSHRNISDIHETVSPSSSSASNGSTGSSEHPIPHEIPKNMARSISPRASSPSIRSTSPHLLRSYGSPPPIPSHLHSSYMPPTSPPPQPPTRKTRVPGLTRKKSTISAKRKISLISMLTHDDLTMRCDGLKMLARKLASHPYNPQQPDLSTIQIESSKGMMDGEALKEMIWQMFQEDNARLYEALSTWDSVAGILLKLVSFEEYVPRLILDASADAVALKTDDDLAKFEHANHALKKVKHFLKRHEPNMPDRLYAGLMDVGGFGNALKKQPSMALLGNNKKDPMRHPANRRKLTSRYLEWMDELVLPMLGLDSSTASADDSVDPSAAEWMDPSAPENAVSQWFESDAHVRLYLEKLLPLVSTSSTGSIVHAPLVSLVGHLRLVNQKLFEAVASTYDTNTVNKIGRVLGIHIRIMPDYVCQVAPVQEEEEYTPTTDRADSDIDEPSYPAIMDEQPMATNGNSHNDDIPQEPAFDPPPSPPLPQPTFESNPVQQPKPSPQTSPSPYPTEEEPVHPTLPYSKEDEPVHPTLSYTKEEEPVHPTLSYSKEEEPVHPTIPNTKEEFLHPSSSYRTEETLRQQPSFTKEEPLRQQPSFTKVEPLRQQPSFTREEPFRPSLSYTKEEPLQPSISYTKEEEPLHASISYEKEEEPLRQANSTHSSREEVSHHQTNTLSYPRGMPLRQPSPLSFSREQHRQPSPLPYPKEDHAPPPQSYPKEEHPQSPRTLYTGHVDEVIKPFDQQLHLNDLTLPVAAPFANDALRSHPLFPNDLPPKQLNGKQESNMTAFQDFTRPADLIAPNDAGGLATVAPTRMLPTAISTGNNRRIHRQALSHVPYFAPKEVIDPLPVFKENKRTDTTMPTMINGRGGRDKTATIYALVDKLKSHSADNASFRKLARIAREASIIQPWDQGGSNEASSELWAGANQDGGNFVELVQGILLYLSNNTSSMVLDLLRQLAVTQVGLFKFYERKVDDQGMSLEARLIERLLLVRADNDPTISTGAEDALDTLLSILDSHNVFDIMISYLVHRLILAPASYPDETSRYHPVGTAFTYMAKSVKEVENAFFIEEWLAQGGANVFLKGVNHPMIHVRKSCVEAIVDFHGVMDDEIYQFLEDLREDQLNLVRHYVARAIKQRAGLVSYGSTPTQL